MQLHNPNIFYTDDDIDDQDLFRDALTEIDDSLVLITASDGDVLLRMLKQSDVKPRVIFLDLNMPRKNGYEVLEAIRRDEKLKHFPVVIFSTTSNDKAISKTREMGANLFVSKPLSYKGLKQAIATCVNMDWKNFDPASNTYFHSFT
jgi:CheY-like chemotaxis protein